MMNKNSLFAALLLVPTLGFASDVDGTIVSVLAGEVYANKVFLEVSPKPSSPPGCHTNARYSYVFDPTTAGGKVVLALVMTAYASGSTVYFNGYSTCGLSAGVETLREVRVK